MGRARSSPQNRGTLFLLALAIGALLAAGLSLVGAPAPLHVDAGFLAHLCGFLAGYAVAVMVLLMSRAPVLERHIGADRLARWHAAGGRIFIVLMLVHATSAVAAWAAIRQLDPVSALIQVLGFPGMIAATV